MSKLTSFVFIVFLSAVASLARAEVPVGLWKSNPDAAGSVMHVRTKPCGRALCGRVERAKDRRGYDTPSSAVGQKLLWDMIAQPDGSYQGKVLETKGNRILVAKMQLQGNRMQFQNCDGDGCEAVVWTRLR